MRNFLVILLTIITIAVCSCNSNKQSKEPLPIDQMKYLMWDMLKADEFYIRLTTNDTAKKFQKENLRLYDQIFRSYGVSKEKFYSSYKFYESHPNLFKELIDSVENLSKRQRNLQFDSSGKLSQ